MVTSLFVFSLESKTPHPKFFNHISINDISSKKSACLGWIKIVLKCGWLVFQDKKK
jgi:hypothetical protein